MSDASTLPNRFTMLNRLIVPRGSLNSAAELHGMLCGKLSGGAQMTPDSWLAAAVEFLDLTDAPDTEVATALDQLLSDTREQLGSEHFALALVLPDDEVPMEQRVEALGQWCHGFLSGFGSAGISGDRKLSPEAAEALRDFAAIAQIEPAPENGEQSEANLMEVTEYVKVAALSLYLELGAPQRSTPTAPTLH